MTGLSLFILAKGDAERVVVLVIFALLWGAGALASWIKKVSAVNVKQSSGKNPAQARRTQPPKQKLTARQQYRPNPLPQNACPASIIQRAQSMASYATRQPVQRKPGRKPPRLPPPLPAARGQVVAPQRVPMPALAPALSAPLPQVIRRQPPGIVAGAAVMGLKADTLRQQIILAEILQPPITLR